MQRIDAFEHVINDIMLETKGDVWKAFCCASAKADKIDKKSCLMHLFLSVNYWSEGSTHLEVCSLDFMHGIRNLKNRNILILNPPEYTARIKRLNSTYKRKTAGITDLNEIVYNIACYMDSLAKLSDLVSSNVSCGISLRISEYEIILRRIDASAKEIKRLYRKTGDLSELMMIERIKTKESAENMRCTYCGSYDHTTEYCSKTWNGQINRASLRCSYCGSNKHNRDACPKCWSGDKPIKLKD